ncbi:MAG: ATP-binding protein [bacterium]
MVKKNSWYKTLFEKSTEAVIVIEPNTWLIVDANESAKKLLNLSSDKINNKSIPEFEQIYHNLQDVKLSNIMSGQIVRTEEKEEKHLEISAGIIEFDGKKLIQAILRNYKESDSLTERLIQADKLVLLGQLSAGVAHEIRNPLAAVNLNLQLLARKYAEGTSEFNSIQTALQGVERISRIVEITLNFSKPSTPDIQKININSIISTSLDLVAAEFKKKEIKVETKLDESLPLLSADAKQMQQVLINLLTNAADSINVNGNIKLRTYVDELKHPNQKNIVISIEDNGIGISQEELPKIFNPFFTKKSNGTGLGLSISQRIVQQHNGKIDVISKAGKGTIFNVYLPV